ncbi:MAG: SDR family NAD(P)-dependent oxidoreductase [Thermoanaerobaculia bacterium]
MSLEGKGAVVTGGGRGIGAEVARELARKGARVVVAARSEEEIAAVAEELRSAGAEAWAAPCDVADEDAVAELARRAEELLGTVDVLVNNAGIGISAPLARTSLAEWNRIMAVNATGVFLCTRALLAPMVERGWGRVVTVASVAGKAGAPYISTYVASKHAAVGFTRAVAMEVAATGVTVNAVCPGYVDTPLTEQSIANVVAKTGRSAEEARRLLEKKSPQDRLFRPEEIAWLVGVLCDPRSGGINGQAVVLDGGMVQS